MPIKIQIDKNKVGARIMGAWDSALPILSEEILADCNEYCKEDSGALIKSSLIHSRPAEGKLVWETPYAKRQYWAIETSLTAGRTWKWCETAKNKWRGRWQKLAEMLMRGKL